MRRLPHRAGCLEEKHSRPTLDQERLSHNMLYVDGESKLAHHLASLAVASYTEQWSALAPAGVLV
jgi:hypothetical protein